MKHSTSKCFAESNKFEEQLKLFELETCERCRHALGRVDKTALPPRLFGS